jgi:hypothetical protein
MPFKFRRHENLHANVLPFPNHGERLSMMRQMRGRPRDRIISAMTTSFLNEGIGLDGKQSKALAEEYVERYKRLWQK